MIDGTVLVERLLLYATENLQLAQDDVCVKRNLLLQILNLSTTDMPQIEESLPFGKLKMQLMTFARENKLCNVGEEDLFAGFIIGTLMPLPSSTNKKFRALREKFGAHAACEYLYDLSTHSGQVPSIDFNESVTPYIVQDGLSVYTSNDNYLPTDLLTHTTYPKCPLCPEVEGYIGAKGMFGGGLRSVALDLNGEKWNMRFARAYSKTHEGIVCYPSHDKRPTPAQTFMAMLDFIEYLPEYSAEVYFNGDSLTFDSEHTLFSIGITTQTQFDEDTAITLSSVPYPDVEITAFNDVYTALRLQSFNRNTLERIAIDIIEKWQNYSDTSMGIYGRGIDGKSLNNCAISARYAHDNRYAVDIVLSTEYFESGHESNSSDIFDSKLNYPSMFGRFILEKEMLKVTESMVAVLTKKIPLDNSLFAENAVLNGYEKTLKTLIEETGYFKDAHKAENASKQAILTGLKGAVSKKSAFPSSDDGVRNLRKFLASINIR